MITLSLMMIRLPVYVSPFLGSPFTCFHFSLPVFASRATRVVSARPMISVSPAICGPRLTVSQHMTGMTDGSCLGSNFQRIFGSVGFSRLSLKTLFGNAE